MELSFVELKHMLSSTRSDQLPLITATMHSTVPIPKMTGRVELEPCFTMCLLLVFFFCFFCINGLRERLLQQGNARLVPHAMDCI